MAEIGGKNGEDGKTRSREINQCREVEVFVMKKVVGRVLIFAIAGVAMTLGAGRAGAVPADLWWDEGWPYRVRLTVSGSGVVRAPIDFTAQFAALGVPGALLDVRSHRPRWDLPS